MVGSWLEKRHGIISLKLASRRSIERGFANSPMHHPASSTISSLSDLGGGG
jgi:hypothetical protein